MKFEQGYYTLKQIEDMINVHSNGKVHIEYVLQKNNQLCVMTSNNLKILARMK